MVDGAVGGARPAPAQTGADLVGRYVDEEGRVDGLTPLGQGVVEGAGLLGGAGEPVEQRARGRVGPVEALAQHADGDLVGDEFTAVHVALGEQTQLRPAAHVLAEHVAGGDVHEAGRLDETGGLGAFAGAGGAEQDDVHR